MLSDFLVDGDLMKCFVTFTHQRSLSCATLPIKCFREERLLSSNGLLEDDNTSRTSISLELDVRRGGKGKGNGS